MLSFLVFSPVGPLGLAAASNQTITQHSFVLLNGYMDDTKIYQTDSGFAGQKMVVGTRGSGFVSRRQSVDLYKSDDGNSGMDFNEWAVMDYKPYTPNPTESQLKNALCAKNYDVGSVFSESYSNINQLFKDTNIHQDENVSVYQMHSYIDGTAKVGARYQNGSGAVPTMTMGSVYVGQGWIQEEMVMGDNPPLILPCP
ncbi:MAG: hypothetical protein GKC10_03125 [Methanosarcinales archaeon]|nr:hypothetical protein [Methanosarcinales archaeon]